MDCARQKANNNCPAFAWAGNQAQNHILKGTATTAEERQTTFKDMMKLALETIIQE